MIVRCYYCNRKLNESAGEARLIEGHWYRCTTHLERECEARQLEQRRARRVAMT